MSTFALFVIGLTFFAAPLPLSFLTVIWGEVSENLTVGIPYISILRTMIAAGAILSCIVCDKLKGKRFAVDLVVIAVNLEALSILGFSLSRVFWNLALWAFLLGFGLGMSLTLLSLGVVFFRQNTVILFFAFAAAGTACGAWILDAVSKAGHIWRTDCQILAICQILLSFLSFFLIRKRISKKSGMQLLQEEKRAWYRRRENEKRGMEKSKGPVDERIERRYFLQMGSGYLAAFLCSFMILAMALLPSNYLLEKTVSLTSEGYAVYGVIIMASGILAGRLTASFLKIRRELLYALSCALLLLVLLSCAVIMHDGTASVKFIFAVQFLCGTALGPVFPCLLLIDDVRFDRDRENSFTGLLPAFYLGSLAFITPAAQALSGGGGASSFVVWMLAMAVILSLDLFFICRLSDN